MTPENVRLASLLLTDVRNLESTIESIKAPMEMQVMYGGQYWADRSDKEALDAARVGLLKLHYARRATKIAELRALGVEVPE